MSSHVIEGVRTINKERAYKIAYSHLTSGPKNKFTHKRRGMRIDGGGHGYVKPKDRIPHWNIVKGDRVRLMVGKAKDKYNDENEGHASGYKVYTVADINRTKNRVFLEGLTNKRSQKPRPLPDNFESLSQEEKQQYLEQKNYLSSHRPVQYSNLQLCVEDAGANSVFATRVTTTPPVFSRELNRITWERYAIKVSGKTTAPVDEETGRVHIPWPEREPTKPEMPTRQDTLPVDAQKVTLKQAVPTQLPRHLVPGSMRAPPPSDQQVADEWFLNPEGREAQPALDTAMTMYLSEELSPRHSRAKKQQGWTDRQRVIQDARTERIERTVAEWEAGGRDKGLADLLSHQFVNLEGVEIRPRTPEEIKHAAAIQFDEEIRLAKRGVQYAKREGKVFNFEAGVWEEGAKGLKTQRKREYKAAKQARKLERMANLTLEDAKNQVVPADLRA